jgi:hypothetical protein
MTGTARTSAATVAAPTREATNTLTARLSFTERNSCVAYRYLRLVKEFGILKTVIAATKMYIGAV